jgi:subtilase family serine protease
MKLSGKNYRVAVLRVLYAVLLCSAMLLLVMRTQTRSHAQAAMPTRHVRQQVVTGEAVYLNRLPANKSLRLNIALPLRNQAELDVFLQELNDPQNPLYRQFLSVEEFTERFGPTQADYDAVVRFAQNKGLTVTDTFPNRMLVNISGTVANIEKAFNVTMGVYQHPTEPRTFFAADREPTPDLDVPLWHITGLDNFSLPHPMSLKRNPEATHTTGSGPSGYFLGSDMRAAYYGGTALTGAGQSVGLLEFLGYNQTDVTTYFSKIKQTLTVTVTGVSTDGSSLSCTGSCDDSEQVLDIDQAISMAPGMSHVYVYVSDTSDVSIFTRMASDNLAKSLSCSWGWQPADPNSDDPIFKEFSAQGQNLFVASGDSGAYSRRSEDVYPADDAFITSVGGTDLTTASAGGAWKSETGWADSGGGISPNSIAIPSYQTTAGVITTANKGSKTLRNSPDVAAEANTDNYLCSDGGECEGGWGGTSFAAPRWAGYLALVNQQAVANGLKTPGFINPTIYTIGLGSTYATCFHDITSGSNGTYSCQKGYDLVTGWGSPNGTGLINALAP